MLFDLAPARDGFVQTLDFDQPVAVIGDIHGRSDLLQRLLARLPDDMPIIVVGDVGDRGPDTRGVVDTLLARGAVGVRGNHEEWLVDWAEGHGFDDLALHPAMGGEHTLASYGVLARTVEGIEAERWRVPEAHRAWLGRLALALDLGVGGERYWVVHAGIPSTVNLSGVAFDDVVPFLVRTHPATLLWAKNDPEEMLPVDRTVIMGHVRRRAPLDTGDVLAIDTGAGTIGTGGLTAVVLPERRFVTVRAEG
jgi:serine/threonine protein phosphatase 1